MKNKKAQISIYFIFIVMAIVLGIISAVVAPMLINMNTQFYLAGESIINMTETDLNKIQDSSVKSEIATILTGAKSSTVDNIEILGALYQYAWIIVLVLIFMVLFLFTRRMVEFGGNVI